MPLDSPYLQAAAAAIEAGFGRRPVFIREGGSIPVVNTFADVLAPTCCCWAGARTTTTRTAPTRSSRSPTSTAASGPVRRCGRSCATVKRQMRDMND